MKSHKINTLLAVLLLFLIPHQIIICQSALDSIKGIVFNSELPDSLRAFNADRLAGYYIGRNTDSAVYYNEEAFELVANIKAEKLLIGIKLAQLDIHRHRWSMDTLDHLYQEVLAEAEAKGFDEILLKGLISHSALFSNQGQGEKGTEILLRAIPIAERMEAYTELGKIQYNMAAIYSNMGMSDLSNIRLKDAHLSFTKAEQPEFALLTLNSIANNFNNMEQLDSAKQYLDIIMPSADSIGYTKLQVEARSTLGAILLSEKNYIEAKKVFNDALPIAEKMGNELSQANCLCNLGRANYYLGEYQDALRHLERAYEFQVFKDNLIANEFCVKEMALTQQKLGNYKEASEYFERYVNYQDTVLIKENKLVVAELEAKYETTRKEAEIQEQEAEINQRTYQRNLLFGGLGLSLMLGGSFIWGLFSRNNRNKKIAAQDKDLQNQKIQNLEKEKKLLSMSSLLEGQESERIRIAKDLHDGLGGLLTTVKAHFGKIQAEIEKVENMDIYLKANQMIDKAHDEVRRISHNLMPADLRVGGLPVAIRQLVHELRTIHEIDTDLEFIGFNNERLEEKIELSTYRIVQELINNILKYAESTQVFVQVSKFGNELQVVVEDNGIGFDYQKKLSQGEGLGLKSIHSRVTQLNGDMDVVTEDGKGTSVTINIPLSIKTS